MTRKNTRHLLRFSDADTKLIRVLKFFIKFNLFAIPLYIILYESWTIPAFQQLVASITTYLLSSLGMNPTMNGLLISIPVLHGDWAAFISWDCTGWKSLLAYFALVMATDYPVKRKLAGLLLLPVIFAINMLRIVFMFFYVRTFDLAHYQTVHAIIWSWGLIITIIALWLVWMRWDFTKIGRKPARRNIKRTRMKR